MKKTIALFLITLVFASCILVLTSCGQKIPSGTYFNEQHNATYVFNGGKYDYSGPVSFYVSMGTTENSGTYKISNNGSRIRMKRDGSSYESLVPFEMGDGYIKIDGFKFTLQK